MNAQQLINTAKALVADDKGLLAMDESNPTCNQRFAKLGIPQTEEMRRAYRELIVTTPGLSESISGAILYDETIRQTDERWHSLRELPRRCGDHSGHQSRYRREGPGGSSGRENHRRSRRIARPPGGILPNGSAFCQVARRNCHRAKAFPPGAASRPTRMRWPATPRCVRKPDWSPWSSRKCSWTARTRWNDAAK